MTSPIAALEAAAAEVRAKLGQLPGEIEAHFGAFLSHAKVAEAKVDAAKALLEAAGYTVTKNPS
jgi:hypothetical protein